METDETTTILIAAALMVAFTLAVGTLPMRLGGPQEWGAEGQRPTAEEAYAASGQMMP